MFDAITLSTVDIDFLKIRRVGTKILKSESLAWNLTLRKTRRDARKREYCMTFGYLQVFLSYTI
jgi:hypothetical protein